MTSSTWLVQLCSAGLLQCVCPIEFSGIRVLQHAGCHHLLPAMRCTMHPTGAVQHDLMSFTHRPPKGCTLTLTILTIWHHDAGLLNYELHCPACLEGQAVCITAGSMQPRYGTQVRTHVTPACNTSSLMLGTKTSATACWVPWGSNMCCAPCPLCTSHSAGMLSPAQISLLSFTSKLEAMAMRCTPRNMNMNMTS